MDRFKKRILLTVLNALSILELDVEWLGDVVSTFLTPRFNNGSLNLGVLKFAALSLMITLGAGKVDQSFPNSLRTVFVVWSFSGIRFRKPAEC